MCFGTPQTDLPSSLQPLADLVSPESLTRLKFVTRKSYELRCNWKVYVDNYLDGGYHVEIAHRGLASQLDLDNYETSVMPGLVLQTCRPGTAGTQHGQDFAERVGDGAVYAWLYPNFIFNRYGGVLDTNWVIPLAPDRCLTIFDYYFENTEEDFVNRSLAASHQVQLEDIEICESVQRGLRSSGYDVGRYAPSLEMGEYHFHHWLRRDLALSSAIP